ncbi:MAG: class I tRNA ligase family protein, partial [Alphaproteobacteria bacterium]
FNWLTFYGGKFSTSQKRGIFTNQALDEFQPDYWRYWLMANAPESSDSSFTFTSFAATINKDLNDVLGNFVNRVLKMTASKIGSEVPAGGEWTAVETEFAQTLQNRIADYTKYLSELEFRKALVELRAIWVEGNNYLTAAAPWTVIKENQETAAMILRLALNVIRLYAVLSAPVIPETAGRILELLNLKPDDTAWPSDNLNEELRKLKPGYAFKVPEQPLFQKITPETVEDLCHRYGGNPEE